MGGKDGLDFAQYASILARAALDTPEPFTIGVYGTWGSGKTSLMRMVKELVDKENKAMTVWFNAWRYEREEHLITPLLATIIEEMERQESKCVAALAEGLRKTRDALRAILYGISVKGKVGIPGLTEAELSVSPKDMFERYEKLGKMATEQIVDRSLYFRSFAKLDEIAGSASAPKLIIFIDDLDRCFPDKAVELLESIKLVLSQPNVTFVLGIAPPIIRAYLAAKYKKDYGISEELYDDYLDKLVQLPFKIPVVKRDVEEYVRTVLKRQDVFGKISTKEFNAQYEPLVSICGPACKNNPRGIVRFLNRPLILTRIHEEKQNKTEGKKTAISLVDFGITNALDMKWPTILEACEVNRKIAVVPGKPEEKPLCDVLKSILSATAPDGEIIASLEKHMGDENPVKDVFKQLADDESLRTLLRSEPGRKWLSKSDLRKEAAATTREVAFGREADGALINLIKRKQAPTDDSAEGPAQGSKQ